MHFFYERTRMNKFIAALHAASASLDTVREDIAIANAFSRIADVVGLTHDERTVLFGATRDPSRVILALETISAALELLRTPEATVAWLRAKNADAPFHWRTPLALFAADGQMGVEITLLYLHTRLRDAAHGGDPAPPPCSGAYSLTRPFGSSEADSGSREENA
jgi:hypothetical protein